MQVKTERDALREALESQFFIHQVKIRARVVFVMDLIKDLAVSQSFIRQVKIRAQNESICQRSEAVREASTAKYAVNRHAIMTHLGG